MKSKLSRLTRRSFVGIGAVLVLGLSLGTGGSTWAQENDEKGNAKVDVQVFANFTVTLQAGVLHGFQLGPVRAPGEAPANRGYVVVVSPLDPANDGAFVQSFVEPETNGIVWIDVLRVKLGAASAPVNASIRVYALVPRAKNAE